MDTFFQNKTAVITGGTSGIGKAVALELASKSANVVIAGRNKGRGAEAEKEISNAGGNVAFIQTDISDEKQVQSLFSSAKDSYGSIDFLFNNAGVEGPIAPVTDYPLEALDEVCNVNFKGTFLCAKYALKYMAEQGKGVIVNTASFVGTTFPFPAGMAYGASKAAVLSMTSALSEGYKDQNISVMAVCPWMVETPMLERLTGGVEEARENLKALNPSGEFASAAEIASVVTGMFTGKNGYSTGQAFLVDADSKTQQIRIPLQTV